ncbi:hypothetical protein HN873_033604, partial [Arachis hypogaea]
MESMVVAMKSAIQQPCSSYKKRLQVKQVDSLVPNRVGVLCISYSKGRLWELGRHVPLISRACDSNSNLWYFGLSHQYFTNDFFDFQTKHILICINIYRSFQFVPVIFGMFVYKTAVLVQVYRDNEDLQLIESPFGTGNTANAALLSTPSLHHCLYNNKVSVAMVDH